MNIVYEYFVNIISDVFLSFNIIYLWENMMIAIADIMDTFFIVISVPIAMKHIVVLEFERLSIMIMYFSNSHSIARSNVPSLIVCYHSLCISCSSIWSFYHNLLLGFSSLLVQEWSSFGSFIRSFVDWLSVCFLLIASLNSHFTDSTT
jgi:hypothetical protein